MNNKYLILVLVVAVVLFGGWMMSQYISYNSGGKLTDTVYTKDVMDEGMPGKEMMDNETPVTQDVADVKVNVTAQNFSFSTKEIRVKQGDPVELPFSSAGGFHDWVVDEFGARTKRLDTGESETIKFVADKSGTFEYYCSVSTHRQMGMVGKLIVEP